MKKSSLHELAAFMCESGIMNYGRCKPFARVKNAAAYMLRRYSDMDDRRGIMPSLVKMNERQYLEYKIYFTLLAAESLPKKKAK